MTKKPGRPSAASLAVVTPEPPAPAPRQFLPEPPAHLSADAKAWWRDVTRDYDLEHHHLLLLRAACEALDRGQQARKALADHGSLTFTDERGTIRTHPAVAVERDARIALARLVRELDLDAEPPAERSRPPGIRSNRRG